MKKTDYWIKAKQCWHGKENCKQCESLKELREIVEILKDKIENIEYEIIHIKDKTLP